MIGELGTLDLEQDPDDLAGGVDADPGVRRLCRLGSGQLEAEIEAGAWFVVNAEPGDAMADDPDQLWKRVLRRQGGPLALVAAFPPTPAATEAARPVATHEVRNQPPPLEGYDVFGQDQALVEGRAPGGRRVGRGPALAPSAPWRARPRPSRGASRPTPPAGAAHPRPLRPPHRRGRVPPELPPADGGRGRARACTPPRGATAAPGRPRGPGRRLLSCGARSRPATAARSP